tara:strand:+ start:392 stop:568 length:177 start_codon:yes stop_codon:yes gene_type:complete
LIFFVYVKQSGADGVTPAWFLVSRERTSGVHGKTFQGRLTSTAFFSIIHTEDIHWFNE